MQRVITLIALAFCLAGQAADPPLEDGSAPPPPTAPSDACWSRMEFNAWVAELLSHPPVRRNWQPPLDRARMQEQLRDLEEFLHPRESVMRPRNAISPVVYRILLEDERRTAQHDYFVSRNRAGMARAAPQGQLLAIELATRFILDTSMRWPTASDLAPVGDLLRMPARDAMRLINMLDFENADPLALSRRPARYRTLHEILTTLSRTHLTREGRGQLLARSPQWFAERIRAAYYRQPGFWDLWEMIDRVLVQDDPLYEIIDQTSLQAFLNAQQPVSQ